MLLKALRASVATLLFITQAHAQFYGSVSLDGGTANPPVPDFSICAPYANPANHIWYFDPVNGFAQNDYTNGTNGAPLITAIGGASGQGTSAHPWQSLQASFTTQTGYPRPLLSTVIGGTGASPITPGDEILLMSGNYGDIVIGQVGSSVSNSSWVTISAAPGQTPVIGNPATTSVSPLKLFSATKFAFTNGLKFQKATPKTGLIDIRDSAGNPTRDILFDHDIMNSQDDVSSWTTPAQWQAGTSQGIFWAAGGEQGGEDGVSCGTMSHNLFQYVAHAINIFGDRIKVTDNEIDHFTGDGIDYASDNQLIQHNFIHDRIDDGSGDHGDGMQGFINASHPFEHDVTIDGNVLHYQDDPVLPFFLQAGTSVTVATVRAPQTGVTPVCSTTGNPQVLSIATTVASNPAPLVVGAGFELDVATTGGTPANLLTNLEMATASITGTGPWVVTGLVAATSFPTVAVCPTTISPGNFYDGTTTISSPTRAIGTQIGFTQASVAYFVSAANYGTGQYTMNPAKGLVPGAAVALGNPASLTGGIGVTNSDWTRLNVTNNVIIFPGNNGYDNLHDSLVANNTILQGCLLVGGPASIGNNTIVIRNNLVDCYSVKDPLALGDHNTIIFQSSNPNFIIGHGACCFGPIGSYFGSNNVVDGDPTHMFINYVASTLTYDVRLQTGAAAIGAGVATTPLAPRDINGVLRVAPFDVGAYNH